jgi:alpha-tubulin suppressor-like RCC1 family protein
MMNFFAWGPGGDIQVGGGHMMNSFAWGPGGDIQVGVGRMKSI